MTHKSSQAASPRRERAAIQRRREQTRTILILAGGFFILIAVFLFSIGKSSAQNAIPARIGSDLGDFRLTDLNGKTVQLSDYKGKPVLINAWATWCPPCKAEMPLLNQYYQAHASQGFVLLAVNAGETQSDAADFANRNKLAFTVLLDPGTQLLDQLGIHSFPTSILVGRDGRVKAIHIGMFTTETIETEITPFLN